VPLLPCWLSPGFCRSPLSLISRSNSPALICGYPGEPRFAFDRIAGTVPACADLRARIAKPGNGQGQQGGRKAALRFCGPTDAAFDQLHA
jgi:hypothetical protein